MSRKTKTTKTATRECYVCDEQVKRGNFESHMESHKGDIETLNFSNDMRGAVKAVCRLCDKEFILTRIRGHTKDKHGMSITDYKVKFNIHRMMDMVTDKVFHRCNICSDVLLLDSDVIASHLHGHSGITHKQYNDRFMTLAVPRKGQGDQADNPQNMRTVPVQTECESERKHAVENIEEEEKENLPIVTLEDEEIPIQTPLQIFGPSGVTSVPVDRVFVQTTPRDQTELPDSPQKKRSKRFLSHSEMHLIAWPHQCDTLTLS